MYTTDHTLYKNVFQLLHFCNTNLVHTLSRKLFDMEIEIVSKECIKPSSPTPSHLKTFKLSALDYVVLTPFVPVTLYYPNSDGETVTEAIERSITLKESLSRTLTQFYTLAGTILDDFTIDCNDNGAQYIVAKVNRRLDEFLNNLDLPSVNRFLPCEPSCSGSTAGSPVTNVQINIFECGSIAIGLCISHKVIDGAALTVFLKGWTNMACGSTEMMYPNFTAPSLFPQKVLSLKATSMGLSMPLLKQGKCTTRRFVFESDSVAKLKAEAIENGLQRASRLEVVSAFIWKCAMAASKEVCGFQKASGLSQIVNLRTKLNQPMSQNFIGNLVWLVLATSEANHEPTMHGLATRVRESTSKVNSEFVEKSQGDEGHLVMQKSLEDLVEILSKETMDVYGFTSLCKLGYYEFDFGWGKPIWMTGIVAEGSPVFMNMVNMLDMKSGEGVETWVHLDEPEMEILMKNQELLAYASLDPSPLKNGN
ncbi:stemmadenine O-acetyltransferase [Lactuca sativa]|nr:stemmadenine O-acetyltransferase [Lactuca sativa]